MSRKTFDAMGGTQQVQPTLTPCRTALQAFLKYFRSLSGFSISVLYLLELVH